MIRKMIRKFLIYRNAKEICRKCRCGKNIQFATSSSVSNTGKQDAISLGNHGCMYGALQSQGGKIQIGDHFFIGVGTHVQSVSSVKIGDNVIISTNVLIVDNNNHPIWPEERLKMSACEDYMTDELWTWKYSEHADVVIEDNVWIGRDARVLKGVTIGKGSVIAMGTIVTHDVPPYSICAGNPGKIVKSLSNEENSCDE